MPGNAEQPGLLVEQLLHLGRREAQRLEQVEDHARDRATPGRVPMQSPSSAVKPSVLSTLLPPFSAHRLAPLPRCATMTRPVGDVGRHLGQHRGDVLVREAVEAVALDAALADRLGQRDQFGDGRLAAVEARVEAGHLRHAGQLRRLTASMAARLCGWWSGASGISSRRSSSTSGVTTTGRAYVGAAVDDPVADAEHARAAVAAAEPAGQRVERGAAVAHRGVELSRRRSRAGAVLRGQSRRRPDALDLAARLQPPGRRRRAAGRRRTSGSTSRH